MDLDNLILPSEPPKPIITCTIEGVLEPEDLAQLVESRAVEEARAAGQSTVQLGDIKKIREKHHSAARLIAGGMQQRTVAVIVGFNESYLSTLLNSPAMVELVGFYRAKNSNAHDAIIERLRTAGLGSLGALEEKLENDDLDANQLLALAKLGLDRAGHGPVTKNHSINEDHIIDHAELRKLNRAARRDSGERIEKMEPPALPAPEDTNEAS